ncbi:MAG: nucleoside-diphosphate kinase [candidate division WOR-3 bacterium]|nr:nucleoside-diphosphate kinase [candidate division WOR-3 bacterium]
MQKTLLLIKPDAVKNKHIGEIITEVEKEFEILDIKYTRLTKSQAKKFYAIHKNKDFFKGLIEFITSGPIVALLLQGPNIQKRIREFIGDTDPKKAKRGTIRNRFGTSIQQNAVHASNPLENPEKEIKFFFPKVK